MKSTKMTVFAAALLLGTGLTSLAFADTEQTDTADVQTFLANPQSMTQAIAAAETATGGKAMDAGWEAKGGAYHVEVAKADGTLVDVIVTADGATQIMPEQADSAEAGDDDGDNG